MTVAQSNFTIVRPADGSKVRETVRILFPKSAVPDNGYVGIYVGGKFLEAIVPIKGANYSYYDLNTKEKGIQDGPLTIEAVLYADFADRPRIIDRSKIDVTVVNSASIEIPEGGLNLRYRFRPGTAWTYQIQKKMATNTLSEAMAGTVRNNSLLAGAEVENIRVQYAVDNAYANGDGLVRIQAVPQKGKHSAIYTIDGAEGPKRYQDYEMAPTYMRLSSTGNEVFGTIPRYFPIFGTGGDSIITDLIATLPLPTFPAKAVRPGDPWRGRFQLGDVDLTKRDEINSVIAKGLFARGELVGVEWEMGHPCARIRNTLEQRNPFAGLDGPPGVTPPKDEDTTSNNSMIMKAAKIEEDIFFALDTRAVVKMVREYTIDVKVQQAPAAGAGGGAAGGGPIAGPAGLRGAGGGGGGASGVGSGSNRNPKIDVRQSGRPPGRGGGQGRGGLGGPGGRPGGNVDGGGTMGGAAPRTGGGGTGATSRIQRVTVQLVFTLEK